jgi:AbiTii
LVFTAVVRGGAIVGHGAAAYCSLELNGYIGRLFKEFPEYRKLHGIPEAFNPYRGWQPIIFQSPEQQKNWSFAPIGMPIGTLEDSLRNARGAYSFPYPPEIQCELRKSLNWGADLRIKLNSLDCANIVHAVRNILLDWTLAMEKQGILGENLTFTPEEREKSASVTEQTINNFHIGQVGAFVQNAEKSVVQGGVESTMTLATGARDLVQQVEQLLPAAQLEPALEKQTHAALDELKEAANSATPDIGRLRKGLESLKRVLAPAGEHLIKIAVDAAVTKLLGGG